MFDFVYTATESGGSEPSGRPALDDLPGAQSPTADFNISVIHGELVAPCFVWFELSGFTGFDPLEVLSLRAYNPAFHQLGIVGDFDDPGTFLNTYNKPDFFTNRNIGFKNKQCHVYETAGTYTATFRVQDINGAWKRKTVEIVVADPDTVYSGNRTICVSQVGDFTGAPAGSNNVTSLSAAQSALAALGQTGRILLRRGETFAGKLDVDDPMVNFRLGSFGDAEDPIPVMTGPTSIAPGANSAGCIEWRTGNGVDDSIVYGIRFQGDWDATKETGDPRLTPALMNTHNTQDGWKSLFYQCEMDGISSFSPATGADIGYTSVVYDCSVDNFRDYAIRVGGQVYNEDGRFAVIGSSLTAAEHACQGGHGKIGLGNDHGGFRYSDIRNVICLFNYIFSASSWAGAGVQPTLRFAQGGNGTPVGDYNLIAYGNVAEGGGTVGGIDGQNDGAPEYPGNAWVAMNYMMNDWDTRNMFGIAYGGTSFECNVMLFADIPEGPSFDANNAFLYFTLTNSQTGNADSPVRCDHNTFINLKTGETPVQFLSSANFNNFSATNNAHYAPDESIIDDTISLTSPSWFVPRNKGRRLGPEKVLDTLASDVANGQTVDMAYPSGTSAADFSPSGRHTVLIDGSDYYFSHRGECSLSFGGSVITITNTSGDTWSSGQAIRIGLDQDTLATDTSLATPTDAFKEGVPIAGSDVIDDASAGSYAFFDIDFLHRNSPTSRGAYDNVRA